MGRQRDAAWEFSGLGSQGAEVAFWDKKEGWVLWFLRDPPPFKLKSLGWAHRESRGKTNLGRQGLGGGWG